MRTRTSIACGLLLLPLIASGCGNGNNNGMRNKETGNGAIISQQSSKGMGGANYLHSGTNNTTSSQGARSTTGFGTGSNMSGYSTDSTTGITRGYGTSSNGGGTTGYNTGSTGGGTTGYSTSSIGGNMSGSGTSTTNGGTSSGYGTGTTFGGTSSYGTGMTGYGTGSSGYGNNSSGASMPGYGNSSTSGNPTGYSSNSGGGSMSGYGTGLNMTTNLETQVRQQGYNDILVIGNTAIVGDRGTNHGQSALRGLNVLTVKDEKAIDAIHRVKRQLTAVANVGPKAASISSDIQLILNKARPAR